jgi:integrase
MARRGLNNFRRKLFFRNGQKSWALESLDGTPVEAFDAFCEQIFGYSYQTQKRYAEVVSRFIDYLYESNAFDVAVLPSHLNKVITAYSTLLQDGSNITSTRVRISNHDLWLADTAEKLNWDPLKPRSMASAKAAVNRFLRLSENLAFEAREKARYFGINLLSNESDLIVSVAGRTLIGSREINAMRQASMFGNVAKFAPQGISRPNGIQSSGIKRAQKRELDFPREFLAPLIGKATSWRDKCLWLLLVTLGLRSSEALNLLISDIDFKLQKIYIFDPSERRALLDSGDPKRMRFKGREKASTYPIPELKNDLYFAIEQYLKLEFVPAINDNQPNYLLQYVDSQRRGHSYVDASDSALAKNFRKAITSANITKPLGGTNWTLHSLRHLYGVYCVNDYPVNPSRNEFGLSLAMVQMMMGHSDIRSTAHYARSKHRRLEAKLMESDLVILGIEPAEMILMDKFGLKLRETN